MLILFCSAAFCFNKTILVEINSVAEIREIAEDRESFTNVKYSVIVQSVGMGNSIERELSMVPPPKKKNPTSNQKRKRKTYMKFALKDINTFLCIEFLDYPRNVHCSLF